ncbi:MAG: T9SS type A sorting domain-containing protein [Chitinophagaceae bacterium]|nr:MAG: T9SS type A sorting domain-containing protein [Chitinophagaceae bacterium]
MRFPSARTLRVLALFVFLCATLGVAAMPVAPAPATGVTLAGRSSSSITLSWTSGSGARRIVVARLTATANAVPVNGTEYTPVSNSFSDGGNPVTGSGNVVVYNGTGSGTTITGLAALTAYSFFVYEYNGSGAGTEYSSAASLTNQTTLAAPPSGQIASASFTFGGIQSSNVVKLDYPAATSVGGSGYLLLYKEGSGQSLAGGDLPVDGTTYTAGGTIGTATIAAVVTSSVQTASNISGLTGSKHFTFFIVPFAGSNSGGTNSFNTSGTIGSRYVPSFAGTAASNGGEAASLSSLVNTTTISDVSQGYQVWQFTLSESDDDALPSIVKSLTISASANSQMAFAASIQSAALFNGSTLLANATVGTNLPFTGLNIVIPDNGSVTLSLRISLQANVNGGASTGANKDGDRLAFQLSNANVSADVAANSSQFASFAPIISAASGLNIYTVAGTALHFAQVPPASVDPYVMLTPVVTVDLVDAGGNRDADYNTSVSISGGLGLAGTLTRTPSAGLATFTGLYFTTPGTTQLAATSGAFSANSATVTVNNVQNAGVYAFNGTSCNAGTLTVTGAATGFTYGSVSYTGLTCNANGNSGGVQALSVSTTWPASFDGTKFIEFTVTPSANWRINPTALAFEIYRSANGATNYAIRSSVDAFAANLGTGTTTTTATATTLSLPASLLGRAGATTFRIYGWGGTSGDLRLDNLMLRGYAGTPLPVTLLRFGGRKVSAGNELNWATASEQGSRGFAVERSADGLRFTEIAFVPGAPNGSSNAERTYRFVDAGAAIGSCYYRLRQADLDGRFSFSPVVRIGAKGGGLAINGIYPNPSGGAVVVQLQAPRNDGPVALHICDATGRILRSRVLQLDAGSVAAIRLELDGLSGGVYYLKVVSEGEQAVLPLLRR